MVTDGSSDVRWLKMVEKVAKVAGGGIVHW